MTAPSKSAIHEAVARGLEYVLSRQTAAGNWIEWELPPGQSSPWSTAFIGYKLSHLRLLEETIDARRRAAEWLVQAEFEGGGWGYNETVGADADSTAYGVLFLSSTGFAVPESAYQRLCQFRQADGGFSTYLSQYEGDSWGTSHPDVTPIVIQSLLTSPHVSSSTVESGINYVRRQQTTDGLWNSFWWETPLYATAACLALLETVNVPVDTSQTQQTLLSFQAENAFETALLLSSRLHVDPALYSNDNCRLVEKLIETQRSDGSWESEPVLRVTRRDCFEPWKHHDAGPRFADPARLFTTTLFLEALSKFAASNVFAPEANVFAPEANVFVPEAF